MYREKRHYGQEPAVVVRSKPPTFNLPLKWQEAGLVFACSWSDWFVDEADAWRDEAWQVIRRTPHLCYQLLTKRPKGIAGRLPHDWGVGWPNVWLGVSVEDQKRADERIPILLETPATVRFVSCEPLLGRVNLWHACPPDDGIWDQVKAEEDVDGPDEPEEFVEECEAECDWVNYGHGLVYNPEHAEWRRSRQRRAHFLAFQQGIDWVIAGSESGPGARPCELDWLRSLRDQCQAAGVPFFLKQTSNRPGVGTMLDGAEYHEFPDR